MRLGKQKGFNPKLSVFFRAFNVNMNRFLSLPAEEEKPVAMMAKDLRHGASSCLRSEEELLRTFSRQPHVERVRAKIQVPRPSQCTIFGNRNLLEETWIQPSLKNADTRVVRQIHDATLSVVEFNLDPVFA
jgi:hypothetical protein